MKVKIEVVVDIDEAAWTQNYGVEGSRRIREDVKGYAINAIREQFASVGVLKES